MNRCLGMLALLGALAGWHAPLAAAALGSNPVADYPFESQLVDVSGNAHHGVAAGLALPGYVAGPAGNAANFDGVDDAVIVPSLPNSVFSGDFSLSWVMRVSARQRYSVMGNRPGCSIGDFFDIRFNTQSATRLTFVLLRGAAIGSASSEDIELDQWVHLVAVREGNVSRVYTDGVAGAPGSVPAAFSGASATPFGLSNSPCIAHGDGTRFLRGQIDDLRIFDRALSAAEVDALGRNAMFTVAPGAASAGVELRVRAAGLIVGGDYRIAFDNGANTTTLMDTTAAGTSIVWPVLLPPLGVQDGTLVLSSMRGSPQVAVPEHAAPFRVVPSLSLVVTTPAPRAGRKIEVAVTDGLAPGSLRLRYGDHIVAGPIPIGDDEDVPAVQSMSFIAPADRPASFPAQVMLRAELVSVGRVSRIGTQTITVAAPYTDPYVEITGIDVSDPLPRPGEPVRIDGQRTINDDTDPGRIETSAFWVGTNGRITSMPTAALAVDANGDFRLDTYPPSLGSMSAFVPDGPGRIRLVTRRPDQYGRMAYMITEGPLLQTDIANYLSSELRITVRQGFLGGSVPVEGAFVVVDANAPLSPQPTNPPAGSGLSGWAGGGQSYLDGTQPRLEVAVGPADAVNQTSSIASQFELPPPACGRSLHRRYTNAAGQAGFQVAGGPEEPPDSWQELGYMRHQGGACDGNGCRVAQNLPWEFNITVYTLHRGAGFIESGAIENIESPSRFKVTYTRDTQTFRIVNLRTPGAPPLVQTGSADIDLYVPEVAGAADDFLVINDPIVSQEVGSTTAWVSRLGDDRSYGKWVEFTQNVSEFANTAPVKVIRFNHVPAVNGSITSAKLFLPNILTGQPSLIGNFQQLSFVEGCNIQDDPGAGASEAWELRLPNVLNSSWRYPRGVYFAVDSQDRSACGFIEVSNFNGATGRRPICFVWQEAPDYFNNAEGTIVVDDSDPRRVMVQVQGEEQGASNATRAPGEFFGEEPEEPGATTSRSTSSSGIFDTITSNGVGGQVRNFNGNNPDQFSQDAEGTSQAADFGDGAVEIQIGDDEFQEIMDVTIPLFQWYWGVPEILSAEVFARLRLLASYLYTGTLTRNSDGDEHIEVLADALFAASILVGVDIDVLFGFIVDAGAHIVGGIQSEIALKTETGSDPVLQPCITFKLEFLGYVDPCVLCPTPVIEFGGPILNPPVQDPLNCSFFPNRPAGSDFDLARGAGNELPFGLREARALRRHPAVAFDIGGSGQALVLAEDGSLNAVPFQNPGNLGVQPPLTLSPAARQAKLAYYGFGRAIAVWMESALTPVQALAAANDLTMLSSNQRVAWATYDGQTWGTKQFLTAPGTGSAHPTLVACPNWETGCPAGGEVFLAFQQNESGNPYQPRNRIRYASWRPGAGWTSLSQADPNADLVVQDMTPSGFYVAGDPFLTWTRQIQGAPSDADALSWRRLAYRHVGVGPARIVSNQLPDSIVAPNMVAGPGGGDPEVLLTFVRPEGDRGPIGTELALHLASAQCVAGLCDWTWHQARDPRGRTLYGERPQYVRGGNFSSIVFRVFRFEGKNGEPIASNDPIGSILSSGDLVNLTPNYANGVVQVTSITADGGMHYGHAAAYDPGSDAVVTIATVYASGGLAPIRSILKKGGVGSVTGYGKLLSPVGLASNIEVRALPALPDFVIESVEAGSASVSPGASVATLTRIANRGTPYVVARDGAAFLELRWNSPASAPLASIALADLADGASIELPLAFLAPASAHGDEAHTLYASIAIAPELDELTGDNNRAEVEFAGLPVPTSLASQTRPGMPVVQLGWDESSDPRIAGYRVYRLDTDGAWMPLGASPNHGFLDLSAQFAVPRTYAVSSYSDRGIESGRSTPITVMPVRPGRESVDIFSDGFETVP